MYSQESGTIFGLTKSKPNLVQKLKDKGIEFLYQIFVLFSIDFAGANQIVTLVTGGAGTFFKTVESTNKSEQFVP